jgi:formate dehydrogenase major subunit
MIRPVLDDGRTREVNTSRFPRAGRPTRPPAIGHGGQPDACIHCNLCVRACREVQVNDVIGMAGQGKSEKIVFDFDDRWAHSTCVACGECVQACPTGALMPATLVDTNNVFTGAADRSSTAYVLLRCWLPADLSYPGQHAVPRHWPRRPANENRLCVKGRFGFDYISHETACTIR